MPLLKRAPDSWADVSPPFYHPQMNTIPAADKSAAEGSGETQRAIAFAKPSEFVRTRESEIRINEIFYSLQGESSRVGLPTVFVRLTGCPLRCHYCDTAYAFHEGRTRMIDDVLDEVATHGASHVCVTGGEPLAQKSCLALLTKLCDAGYSVSLETSGAIDISSVDKRVSRIVDIKTPGSGEVGRNRAENLAHLTANDEIKFVITSHTDYLWSRDLLREKSLNRICPVLFSPSFGQVDYATLAQWVLVDKLPARMQVQLHKIIWGEKRGV
jgi:7-carboxy-7-deazaguanine synthase